MENFRTIGWFGPKCPSKQGQRLLFNVHDYNASNLAPQSIGGSVNFPLDVAMKIFWEAESYRIQSSITATISDVTKSDSIDTTIKWGGIADSENFFPQRPELTTAKEMLCEIQKPPPSWHTLSRQGSSFVFGINPSTFLHNKILSFDMFLSHEIGSLFPADQVFHEIQRTTPQPQWTTRSWSLITPWGNFALPLTVSRPSQVSGSLTITVTAADPEVRYA